MTTRILDATGKLISETKGTQEHPDGNCNRDENGMPVDHSWKAEEAKQAAAKPAPKQKKVEATEESK